ncbi:MAG: IS3 family transposase [Corynebacterium sp.]|nr:IS3 family transposase [Corynebacterium sp.]MDN6281918.1 IS3 family transposase [Corynebacterium sp.]MDN6305686.1 IS3 family transposase [Corynebacterium sp.]MDN6366938.1 IS3 family transposase [Corynebacterium sp.]MDN6375615.1 IS3 family transposase [Corynebacterium sp.]
MFDEHQRCYGAKRITVELDDTPGSPNAGMDADTGDAAVVNHERVARLMKPDGLVGYARRRKVRTTVADQHRRVFSDLVNRRFRAGAVNEVYVGDITYLPIAEGAGTAVRVVDI